MSAAAASGTIMESFVKAFGVETTPDALGGFLGELARGAHGSKGDLRPATRAGLAALKGFASPSDAKRRTLNATAVMATVLAVALTVVALVAAFFVPGFNLIAPWLLIPVGVLSLYAFGVAAANLKQANSTTSFDWGKVKIGIQA